MAAPRDLVALAIVSGVPALLVVAGYGGWRWSRWMLAAGRLGALGLVLTAASVVNLGVPRTCDDSFGLRNRPALAAATEPGACRRSGLAQIDLAALTGLAATLLVLASSPAKVALEGQA
ncbi:MAG: hypothetical protein JF603_15395 [Acidobacteria bacterium]|nr:hypothetical protein [Acidobacteriota bacterium]